MAENQVSSICSYNICWVFGTVEFIWYSPFISFFAFIVAECIMLCIKYKHACKVSQVEAAWYPTPMFQCLDKSKKELNTAANHQAPATGPALGCPPPAIDKGLGKISPSASCVEVTSGIHTPGYFSKHLQVHNSFEIQTKNKKKKKGAFWLWC